MYALKMNTTISGTIIIIIITNTAFNHSIWLIIQSNNNHTLVSSK